MKTRRQINLKHLRYFAEVARQQSVTGAARTLFVTPQTISGQIQKLEQSIGQELFERVGKRLILTTAGTTALDYANAIFALGDELTSVLNSEARPRRTVFRVGITDSVPKLQTVAALAPLIAKHRDELELICQEGGYADLLGRVAAGELDMVLGDATVPPSLARSLHVVVLSEEGTSFLPARSLAARLKGRFPKCLNEAPFLAGSSAHSVVSQALEAWFARHDVRPNIAGRIDDSALLKGFAHRGLGIAAVPTSIEREVANQYEMEVIGRTDEVRQAVYVVRARTRRPHPLVAEIEASRRRN
ncbi:MAG: LysR family transcriptional regulator [Proteobacteria bacterium]|nr:LysR family transcriptional regulator [Pseudomonadota bacterium]